MRGRRGPSGSRRYGRGTCLFAEAGSPSSTGASTACLVRTAIVDEELADAMKKLLQLPGGRRLFRYEIDGSLSNLTGAHLNDYIEKHMGDEFTAKDFRTWGGTLIAAIAFAEHGRRRPRRKPRRSSPRSCALSAQSSEIRRPSPGRRMSAPRSSSSISTGRTLDDFRPRHLRVVGARDTRLDREELALLSLLRSWRIRRARVAA